MQYYILIVFETSVYVDWNKRCYLGVPLISLDVAKGTNRNFTVYTTTSLNPNMTVYIDNYTSILTPEYAVYGIQPTDTRSLNLLLVMPKFHEMAKINIKLQWDF
jgi:hypothetical protein